MPFLGRAELKTRFYQQFYRKPARVLPGPPTFTFTFDDAPSSALQNGMPILDEFGVKGTFYIASALADASSRSTNEEFVTLPEAVELDAMGHHVGCHTFSHYSLGKGSARGLAADTRRNREVLQKYGIVAEDFSYPFGEISLGAKRRLAPEYASLRSNRPGINRDRIDLAFLRAERIYSRDLDRISLAALIGDCARNGGWLIFYTHGIRPDPGPWDATAEDLRWALERCIETSGRVLDLRAARTSVLDQP